jgi:diguanylate cyclase (GGDEF)-like protein
MHKLPGRIAAVMIGTILVFVLTLGGTVLWLTRALDDQALLKSQAQLRDAAGNLLDQVRLVTLDYAKWEAAVPQVDAGNIPWLYENIGKSASVGETMQLIVLWGGDYANDIGWTDDGATKARSSLLDPGTLGLAESLLRDIPLATFEGSQFFAWQGGSLYALGVSRFEVTTEVGAQPAKDDRVRIAMGRRITPEVLAGVESSFLVDGLRIDRAWPKDDPSVPLLGAQGRPVGFLAWDDPRPGSQLLQRLLFPLSLLVLLSVGLAALAMMLVRRGAQDLVEAEQRSAAAARTDALTGLPNRSAFGEALAVPARAGERAILFLDVNGFKRINDSLGHEAGDEVIVRLARRLRRLDGEGRLLARIGGDEFVVLLTGPGSGPQAEALAREIVAAMDGPVEVLGHQLQVRVAVGHAVQGIDGMTGIDLLRQADLAMYEAKRRRDEGPVAFGALIEQAVHDARAIEAELRAALDAGNQFSIAYQPIIGLDGRLVHVEALARWTSPRLGPVPPDRFIAVAEQSGLMIRLGHLLLRLICDDLATYPELQISLNISPLQLMAPTFVQDLLADLAARGIDPGRIEVELTESVVVDDSGLAAERMRQLHEAGFSTALDDFGTGYSSIGYLRQMGFNTLKVDRSFVTGFCDSADQLALVNAMVLLAHALGLRVVCEGVETEDELRMLRELGCDLAQGYHLDRPLPITALTARWLHPRPDRAAVA